jgi:rhodanese-related sulfurtransferase
MKINSLDIHTLQKWLDDDKVMLIDVREPLEFQDGHIEGAVNLPLSNILHEFNNIVINKREIVLQCRIGVRSMKACQILIEDGFLHNVYNLEGGINAWTDYGYKINKPILP